MNIIVRQYNEDDLNAVNSILEDAFSRKKENFKEPNIIELVAVCDGEIAGYLLLTKVLNPIRKGYYCLVDYVCVSSKYRGYGVSDKLMNYAEDVARQNECFYLQLTCSRFRSSAHKLYERCGYIKRDSDIYRKELS